MELKLFVRNLSFNTTESELRELFSRHGEVKSATIAMDRATGRPRGFGFVEMASEAEVADAISALNNRDFGGRTLFVALSEPKQRNRDSQYASR